MPDIDTLNIIKKNIHAMGAEQTGGNNNCCANRSTVQRKDMKQETGGVGKCCTNTESISKSNNVNKPMVKSRFPFRTAL